MVGALKCGANRERGSDRNVHDELDVVRLQIGRELLERDVRSGLW